MQRKIQNRVQTRAVNLSYKSKHLLLNYATGVGKTLAAIKIIDNVIQASDNPRKWHIICWETAHITNWMKDIEKHDMQHILPFVEIYCYASLKNLAQKDVNYILDEGHHAVSDTYWPIITTHANATVFLTATMPREKLMVIRGQYKDLIVDSFDLGDAFEHGLLPTPNIYYVPITLDGTNFTETIHITKGAKVKWSKLPQTKVRYGAHYQHLKGKTGGIPVNLLIECTPIQKLQYWNEQVDYWQQVFFNTREPFHKNNWLRSGSDRKKFIAEQKTPMLQRLNKMLEGRRRIIFCGSTQQAELVSAEHAIHSNIKPKKLIQERIEKFQNKETDLLVSMKMLREGMNLENIEVVIIGQLNKETLSFIQMIGRGLRAEYPEIFVLVAPGTKDQDYWEEAKIGVPSDVIKNYEEFFKAKTYETNRT